MKKVILVIRDGWGYKESKDDNALVEAGTPNTDKIMAKYPNVLLRASGEAVGLPDGFQGNSEVGHLTIGSGRINYQPLMRINKAIKSGDFFKNDAFLQAINNCKENNSKLHLIGLLQSEGVHSHEQHLYALLELCQQQDFNDVLIHVITDGRDAPVNDGVKHVQKLLAKISELGIGKIVTISGRYYAMDRDRRWDRTRIAYDTIVNAHGSEFDDPLKELKNCYDNDETDEFIKPRKAKGYEGVQDNDSLIWYNFRTDRPRQMTKAIVEKDFEGWERKPLNVFYVAMTPFYKPMNAKVAFIDVIPKNLLGEVISNAGLKQLRISETEKYAHVTFFFNGQVETPYKNEDRMLVHSPKVATYDLQPEMSAYEVTEKLLEQINKAEHQFIVVNLVNGDMVGHTGIIEACIKAVRTVDDCLGKVVESALKNDYTLLVFADHGNIEDQSPEWRTSHTINPVPFILVSEDEELKSARLKENMGLANIAPTVLDILGIEKPEEMDHESIIDKN